MQNKLHISEIFFSIQGESSYAGLPCIFIRLSGCNLRCNYCDAQYTWEEGAPLSIAEIVAQIKGFPCSLVEVTGGEPLMQQESKQLLEVLIEEGYQVLLETNGSYPIHSLPDLVTAILDVKCPDSGSGNSFALENIDAIQKRAVARDGGCELKFVLSSEDDFLWACDFIRRHQLDGLLPILFSPVIGRVEPTELAEWIMKSKLTVRLQLQLHTILWPGQSRGV